MRPINTRADLEALRGTPEFVTALQLIYGSMTQWDLIDGAWAAREDLSVLARLGFTKPVFMAEIAQYSFPDPVAPDAPPAPPAPPAPTVDDVAAERDRRLALGFDYDFDDARGVHHIGTAADDMRKWVDEVTPIAQTYLNVGQPDGEIVISTETGTVTITAIEWQHILLAASDYRQPLYQASFVLQAMDPIPADFATNPAYWP